MIRMTRPARFPLAAALLAALPAELVSLGIAVSWLEGTPSDASSFAKFLHTAAGVMHLPGGYLLPLALKAGSPPARVALGACVLFLSGYLDWTLLFIAGIFGLRFLRGRQK